jgi:hypothetical protein
VAANQDLRARVLSCLKEINTLLVGADEDELFAVIPPISATSAHATARWLEERGRSSRAVAADAALVVNRCLTMRQAAKLYFPDDPKAENTLREQGRRGALPTIKLGRYVYVQEATLLRWIGEHERKNDRAG